MAVWVGYPDTLKPMLTEYQGEPVAGGTFPALIWKSPAESALRLRGEEPELPDSPPFLSGTTKRVIRRDGRLLLDNGLCRARTRSSTSAATGRSAPRTASRTRSRCPASSARGSTWLGSGWLRSRSSRCSPTSAKLLQRVDRVVAQVPTRGRLSSYDTMLIVLRLAARRDPGSRRA